MFTLEIDINLLRLSPFLARLIDQSGLNTICPPTTLKIPICHQDLCIGLTAIVLGYYPNQQDLKVPILKPKTFLHIRDLLDFLGVGPSSGMANGVSSIPIELSPSDLRGCEEFRKTFLEIFNVSHHVYEVRTKDNKTIWIKRRTISQIPYLEKQLSLIKPSGGKKYLTLPFSFRKSRLILTMFKLNVCPSNNPLSLCYLEPPLTYPTACKILGIVDTTIPHLDASALPAFESVFSGCVY